MNNKYDVSANGTIHQNLTVMEVKSLIRCLRENHCADDVRVMAAGRDDMYAMFSSTWGEWEIYEINDGRAQWTGNSYRYLETAINRMN